MTQLKHWLYEKLIKLGVSIKMAEYLNMIALLILLVIVALIVDYITKRILWKVSETIAKRTKSDFDDILVSNKLPRNLAHIIPLTLLIESIPIVFSDFSYTEEIIMKGLKILAIFLTVRIIKCILMSVRSYLKTLDRYKDKPIYSYIQVVMIVIWSIAFFATLAIVFKIELWDFITGLGAASAIIILVFRDTILGFVASIQVTVNDMVRIGDWITFDKYGADGDVIEITLATVKVQNWDKTITTIPTYALISDSFKNWRGMTDSGGRRIKRAVIIKASTIKFLNKRDIQKFKKIELISDYIKSRSTVIEQHNLDTNANKSVLINGRNLTNFGVFRKYIQSYMEQHSALNKDMILMARQLAQTPQGIPLEVYAFSKDQAWVNYEYIMGDIFDHILASVEFFDLEIYELSGEIGA